MNIDTIPSLHAYGDWRLHNACVTNCVIDHLPHDWIETNDTQRSCNGRPNPNISRVDPY